LKKGLKIENKMKKVFLTLAVVFAMGTTFAQEKGLHLTLGGGLGWTNFAYDLDEGSNKGRLGYGGTIGAQYFFNNHWGISLAGEIYRFNTQSRFDGYKNAIEKKNDKMFEFPEQVDDEGDMYDFYLHLKNWRENQKTNFFEIPLMAVYQKKFGRLEKHGLYFGLGIKLQIPMKSTFERYEGDVLTEALYHEWELPFKPGWSGDLSHHGYGTNKNRDWNGENTLRTGVAAVGEFGFLFGLSRRVDLTLGVVADYGLANIGTKEKAELLGPIPGVTQQDGVKAKDGSDVAKNVFYNGILNSDQIVDKIHPWSLRGKIGVRIKIGKLKPIEEIEEIERSGRRSGPDTIFVYPIVVYKNPPEEPAEERTPVTRSEAPAAYQPIPDEIEVELIEPIYFDLDKYVLTAKSIEVLNRKVELMKKYPQAVLTVVGHTCDKGTGSHNDVLSANRAEAARMYLIRKGVSPTRIVPIPMGMREPDYINNSEDNRKLNRRVDFYLAR
jgi:outer membrane protein OmpA-like peptidoglycan-associated protein